MLQTQKAIEFKGGLDTGWVTAETAERLKDLSIKSIWLACDSPHDIDALIESVHILKHWDRNKLFCYVLCGYNTCIQECGETLEAVYRAGCMPFAQLYQPADKKIEYSKEWKQFIRQWSRPAIIKSMMGVKAL